MDKKLLKELIRILSVEGQPTKAVLVQTWMGEFFIRLVPGIYFAMLFLPKPPADHLANRRGPPVVLCPLSEKHCFRQCRNRNSSKHSPLSRMDNRLEYFNLFIKNICPPSLANIHCRTLNSTATQWRILGRKK
jgi:hypothetical protein